MTFPRWLMLSLLTAAVSPLSAGQAHRGLVLETMDSGGYTYARVEEGGDEFWIAAPQTPVRQGDEVSFSEQMWMQDFSSSTLDRTFDRILFVGAIGSESAGATAVPAHPPVAAASPGASVEPVAKAEGGYTVAELYARRDELKGRTVKVRGKVVKVSGNIMGLNWVHLQDGSGEGQTADIIFRSLAEGPAVGDLVLAEGRLVTDQDFGFGYVYPVLVDDAVFTR